MIAALGDLTGLDLQNQIGVPDRAQAVCDDDAGASSQQPAERCLDVLLGAGVDAARRLVEDQDARVGSTARANESNWRCPWLNVLACSVRRVPPHLVARPSWMRSMVGWLTRYSVLVSNPPDAPELQTSLTQHQPASPGPRRPPADHCRATLLRTPRIFFTRLSF